MEAAFFMHFCIYKCEEVVENLRTTSALCTAKNAASKAWAEKIFSTFVKHYNTSIYKQHNKGVSFL